MLKENKHWLLLGLTFFTTAFVLFYRLGELPVQVWDEARIAINAIEMTKTGLSLTTTYDWISDHWNTKPPVHIWLVSLSMKLFGANEFALRLPSVLAALSVIGAIYVFCQQKLNKPLIGFISAMLLLLPSQPFLLKPSLSMFDVVTYHGVRAGDYEGLLILFTMGYLLSAFLYLSSEKERSKIWLNLFMIFVCLAFLTKTIQALVFLPAVLIYIFVCNIKNKTSLLNLHFFTASFLVLATWVGYYFLRDYVDPGYLKAAISNDFLRYSEAKEVAVQNNWYYLNVYKFLGVAIFLGLINCFIFGRNNTIGRANIFLLLSLVIYLAVISTSKTKHLWYAYPLFPIAALLIAITLNVLIERLTRQIAGKNSLWVNVTCVFVAIFMVITNISALQKVEQKAALSEPDQDALKRFLRSDALMKNLQNGDQIAIISEGYQNDQGDPYYIAPTLFYMRAISLKQNVSIKAMPTEKINIDNVNKVIACGAALKKLDGLNHTIQRVMQGNECVLYKK